MCKSGASEMNICFSKPDLSLSVKILQQNLKKWQLCGKFKLFKSVNLECNRPNLYSWVKRCWISRFFLIFILQITAQISFCANPSLNHQFGKNVALSKIILYFLTKYYSIFSLGWWESCWRLKTNDIYKFSLWSNTHGIFIGQ